MIRYKKFNHKMICNESNIIQLSQIKNIYNNFNERDTRIILLDFEGDIAQIIIKSDGFLIKLYPIACIYISGIVNEGKPNLIILNTDNNEVQEYCHKMLEGNMKILELNVISFIENLLWYHSDNLDKKIKSLSNNIKSYRFDNIGSRDLSRIASILHNLLLLKNQYQEIQQTLTQINELPNEKLKIIGDINKIEEFSRIINIYQNQFEEDVKNLNRMVKEIEILIQMTEIKFAEIRNKIAVLSLNLDLIILVVSVVSMFGSIFGMNLDSSLEDINYGLYYVLIGIISFAFILYQIIKNYYLYGLF